MLQLINKFLSKLKISTFTPLLINEWVEVEWTNFDTSSRVEAYNRIRKNYVNSWVVMYLPTSIYFSPE